MTPATLSQIAANLRATAGTVNSSNAGEEGYWREIALAAEELAGATSVANALESGYMLRTAVALESIEGTSGAEENRNYPGLLKRIVDAMEAGNGAVGTGSLANRLLAASEDYTGGAASSLFTIDLENGSYSIGGVSKALGDCMFEDLSWGAFNPLTDVVPGVGLTITGNSGFGASSNPSFTEAILAQLRQDVRVTVELDWTLSGDADAELYFALFHDAGQSAAWYADVHYGIGAGSTSSETWIGDYGSIFDAGPTPSAGGAHTVEFLLTAAALGLSLDGTGITTVAPQTNAIFSGGIQVKGGPSGGGVGSATHTIRSITAVAV